MGALAVDSLYRPFLQRLKFALFASSRRCVCAPPGGTMRIQKPRCRVLVVEDEAAISILIEDMLVDFGTEIVGPAARIEEALRLADEEELDLAILDINLSGQPTYPVAEVLGARGIPFVFATGYNTTAVPDQFRGRPTLQKPFSFRSFEDALKRDLAGSPCHREPV